MTSTPWATKTETDKEGKVVRIKPMRAPTKTPWEMAPTHDEAPFVDRAPPPIMPPEAPAPVRPVRAKKAVGKSEPSRLVCAQNYVAREAESGEYGVIDLGGAGVEGRSLLIHVPPKNRLPWKTLGAIRPGGTLSVKSVLAGSAPCHLRVRFTTPARYYSPGSRVTTLTVAVDKADWECLTANVHRI
jgi:hypothetical protein